MSPTPEPQILESVHGEPICLDFLTELVVSDFSCSSSWALKRITSCRRVLKFEVGCWLLAEGRSLCGIFFQPVSDLKKPPSALHLA